MCRIQIAYRARIETPINDICPSSILLNYFGRKAAIRNFVINLILLSESGVELTFQSKYRDTALLIDQRENLIQREYHQNRNFDTNQIRNTSDNTIDEIHYALL